VSSLSLQLALYRRQRQQIGRAVERATSGFRAYQARYRRHTRAFRRSLSFDDVAVRTADADVVYVGDYHTLRAAQQTYQRLAESALARGRRVILALEWIQGRYQGELDALLAGRITEKTFLARTGQGSGRGFDLWAGYAPLVAMARRYGLPVVAIDRPARGPRSLALRDAFAARRIASACAAPDSPLVMVLMGQFHVAPCHLPARVRAALGGRRARELIVYQNCEELYWRLARRGRTDVEAVEVRQGEVCVFSASPVICQQSFLDYLEAEAGDEPLSERGLSDRFRELARLIARFVGVRIESSLEDVEVASAADLDFVRRVRARGRLGPAELAAVRRQALARESYYIPRARMAYLGSLSLNHAAEEAAHFVRHCCVGDAMAAPRFAGDAFYARVLEEAVGFFGSRLVNPRRGFATPAEWARIFRTDRGEQRRIAAFVLAHLAADPTVDPLLPAGDEALFHAVTHALGYMLGDALARAFARGRLGRAEVRALFRDPFRNPRGSYAELRARVARHGPPASRTSDAIAGAWSTKSWRNRPNGSSSARTPPRAAGGGCSSPPHPSSSTCSFAAACSRSPRRT
jgi:hypothetical protein